MEIYHTTGQTGRDGIQREGFRHADPPVGPAIDSEYRKYFWFGGTKEIARERAFRRGWWVILEVPDDTPERVEDGMVIKGVYGIPSDEVNGYPRRYEQGE
jgi:hypothetical protein